MRICDVKGCGLKHVSRGLCRFHYRLWNIEKRANEIESIEIADIKEYREGGLYGN